VKLAILGASANLKPIANHVIQKNINPANFATHPIFFSNSFFM